MISGRYSARPTAAALGAVAVAVGSLLPVGYLLITGVSLIDIRAQFRYPATAQALWQTVGLTVVICALSAAIGVACALLVVRSDIAFPRLLTVVFTMPLAVPGFAAAYAAYSFELTFVPTLDVVTSFAGASLVLALTLYPYVFLPCLVALRHIDPAAEEVVASLRRRRSAVLFAVILPGLRPAIGAGLLIVALHVLAEYGAMAQLGRSTLTTKIMAEMIDYSDYQSARSLSLLLMGLAVGVLLVTHVLTGPNPGDYIARGVQRPPPRTSLGALRLPITGAALMIPLVALGPTVFMTARGLGNPDRVIAVNWGSVGSALVTTLGYGVAAALIATLVAVAVSWPVSRRPSLVATLCERAVWLAHAIPSAILALALVYLATRLVPAVYKTSVVLIAAYVVLFLPLAVANQRVGFDAARRSYDDVAASLGVRPLKRFARITLPLAMPGFITGALLVGLDASKELTTTLILIPFNAHTLSTELWATTNGESLDFSAAAPYVSMLVMLGIPPVYLLVRNALRHIPTPARSQLLTPTPLEHVLQPSNVEQHKAKV